MASNSPDRTTKESRKGERTLEVEARSWCSGQWVFGDKV